jgi:hypothetical protein
MQMPTRGEIEAELTRLEAKEDELILLLAKAIEHRDNEAASRLVGEFFSMHSRIGQSRGSLSFVLGSTPYGSVYGLI